MECCGQSLQYIIVSNNVVQNVTENHYNVSLQYDNIAPNVAHKRYNVAHILITTGMQYLSPVHLIGQ